MTFVTGAFGPSGSIVQSAQKTTAEVNSNQRELFLALSMASRVYRLDFARNAAIKE